MLGVRAGRELIEGMALPVWRLRYRRYPMSVVRPSPQGFEVEDRELPSAKLDGATRDRLMQVAAAMVTGATPEEVAGYLADRFPDEVEDLLARPLESEEMSAHVDVFLNAAAGALPLAA